MKVKFTENVFFQMKYYFKGQEYELNEDEFKSLKGSYVVVEKKQMNKKDKMMKEKDAVNKG